MQKNQVSLIWPLPLLLIVDICGAMDLDLNSSRTQILMGEKWLTFETALAHEIFSSIKQSVAAEYWAKFKDILLETSKNEIIIGVLN